MRIQIHVEKGLASVVRQNGLSRGFVSVNGVVCAKWEYN